MVGLAVLGLAFVFFVVVAFFAAKTWHVGHVVVLVFLFLSTLLFLFLAATLLRTHDVLRPQYKKNVATLEAEQQRTLVLQSGDSATPADESSLIGAQTLARSELLARGRVWRNVRRVPGPETSISLSMERWRNDGCQLVGQAPDEMEVPEPVPDEAILDEGAAGDEGAVADDGTVADDGAADAGEATLVTSSHGIVANQFVYAFKEFPIAKFLTPPEKERYFGALSDGDENFANQDTRGTCRVPLAYLGKFRVVDATDQTISVVSVAPLDAAQLKLIGDPASWVLYEQLPLDSHGLFTDVTPDKLPVLIPLDRLNQLGVAISAADYDAMLREYAKDGKPANEQTDPPPRIVLTVEFVQEHQVPVDLQVEGELPPADRPFTADGRAQVQNLMQGEPTKFVPGQSATFDFATGMQLIEQGFAKRVTATYNRQLRDFEFVLKDLQVQTAKVRDEIAVVRRDFDEVRQATERVRGQIDKYAAEESLLNQDMNGFAMEQSLLQRYMQQLGNRLESLKQDINRLYLSSRSVLAPSLAVAD